MKLRLVKSKGTPRQELEKIKRDGPFYKKEDKRQSRLEVIK